MIESNPNNDNSATLKKLQKLLLSDDRSKTNSDLSNLKKKLTSQILTLEKNQKKLLELQQNQFNEKLLKLKDSFSNDLSSSIIKITDSISQLSTTTSTEKDQLDRKFCDQLLALNSELTASFNKNINDLKIQSTELIDSNKNESLKMAIQIEQNQKTVDKKNSNFINSLNKVSAENKKTNLIAQNETKGLIESQIKYTDELIKNNTEIINTTTATKITAINKKIESSIEETHQKILLQKSDLLKALKDKLTLTETTFSSLLNDKDIDLNKKIDTLAKETSLNFKSIKSDTRENLKQEIDKNNIDSKERIDHYNALFDKKLSQLNDNTTSHISSLENELKSQLHILASNEFYEDKLFAHMSTVLEKKIKSKPEEIIDLLKPIISQVIAGTDSKSQDLISATTSQFIPEHLKKLQNTDSDKGDLLAEIFSKGLPKAIELQSTSPESSFSKSLAPMIGVGLQTQIKVDKDKIVDALYPVIGSTISKYMAESMKDLMDKINKKIDDTFSFKKYLMRLKSKITGKQYESSNSSLVATVQSSYLIHKKTGAVILDQHLTDEENENSQMVGGMFTAITSFVNDWIEKEGETKAIDSIEYGDSKVVFESSGSLILALVVSMGEVQPLKSSARKLLETLHNDYPDDITNYNGCNDNLPGGLKSSLSCFYI